MIPVFNRQKHYYISKDEIQKLIDHGEGWLAKHPYREKIAQRYFKQRKEYARRAIDILRAANEDEPEEATADDPVVEAEEGKKTRMPLNAQRLEAVKQAVLASGATSVIDMGCGDGRLTSMAISTQQERLLETCHRHFKEGCVLA